MLHNCLCVPDVIALTVKIDSPPLARYFQSFSKEPNQLQLIVYINTYPWLLRWHVHSILSIQQANFHDKQARQTPNSAWIISGEERDQTTVSLTFYLPVTISVIIVTSRWLAHHSRSVSSCTALSYSCQYTLIKRIFNMQECASAANMHVQKALYSICDHIYSSLMFIIAIFSWCF